jgi:hypothetical protein
MKKFVLLFVASSAAMTGFALAQSFVGPKVDIAAVQTTEHRLSPGAHINAVNVQGDYALILFWSGKTFSPDLDRFDAFKRSSGERWTRLYAGAKWGNHCTLLVQDGVSASVAHKLCTGWGDVGS